MEEKSHQVLEWHEGDFIEQYSDINAMTNNILNDVCSHTQSETLHLIKCIWNP